MSSRTISNTSMFHYSLLLLLCCSCLCTPRRPSKWHGRLSSSSGATLTVACAQATTAKDNPWAALLYVEDYFNCGATILENQLAITAAHCVNGLQIDDLTLYYGHTFRPDSEREDQVGGQSGILSVRIHPKYDAYNKFEGYDIAVLKLARRVQFNEYVRPIKVVPTHYKDDDLYEGSAFVKIAGFGQTKGPFGSDDPDDWPDQMQLVEHRIVPEQTCNRGNDTYPVDPSQDGLCTRNKCLQKKNPSIKAKYKQICQGDSGSGVVKFFHEDNLHYLLAVVSYAITHDQKECGLSSLPSLSTKTRNHREFIYDENFSVALTTEASPRANPNEDGIEEPTITKGCDLMPQVPHSKVIRFGHDTIKYTCNQDYITDGDPTVICRDGVWSPAPPSCRPKPSKICENEPCHKLALCSPIPFGFQCLCKKGETGDPYGAGCLPETRFAEVLSSDLRAFCGFKTDSSLSKHVQCGNSVSALNAPWQVSIFDKIRRRHHCGGILISKEHVITAAHCFQSNVCISRRRDNKCEKDEFLVFLGRSNATIIYPSLQLLNDGNSITRNIQELYIHPEWYHANHLAGGNDIAILKITSVTNNLFIRPVCLPDPSKHFSLHKSKEKLEITGFGKNNSNSIPHELQLAEMRIIDKLLCDSKLRGKVAPDVFCTVPANDNNKNCNSNPGSCEGDSGGPGVMEDIYGQYVAIGIVAGGPPCGEDESVHPHHMTSISHHLEFIFKHMEQLPCPPPIGAPTRPTCNLQYVQFVSDLRCFNTIDCPEGARCFENSCTLYQDDDQARLAKTSCTTAQQCLDGAFACDVNIAKCNPQVASNGTILHVVGGIQVLNIPSISSVGVLLVFQEEDGQQSSCYGSQPCAVRTTDDELICEKAHCNRLRKCWCPYPVDLLYNLRTGQYVKRG